MDCGSLTRPRICATARPGQPPSPMAVSVRPSHASTVFGLCEDSKCMSDPLIKAALAAREHAHAPFSGFKVGAALATESGRIFTGCNIENATYGLTICAERLAVFKAISEGARDLRRVAVATDREIPAPPCGACRQILWEFCGDAELILVNLQGNSESLRLSDIFPRPFDASLL